jgi:hypothetical protein
MQQHIKKGPCSQQEPRKRNSRYEDNPYPAQSKLIRIKVLKPINGHMHLTTGNGHRWIISNQPESRDVLQALCRGVKVET